MPATVPPIVLLVAPLKMATPLAPLPRADAPFEVTPMKSPRMTLKLAPLDSATPAEALPEIRSLNEPGRAADGIVAGRVRDQHAVQVGQGVGAEQFDADLVQRQRQVVACALIRELDTLAVVVANDGLGDGGVRRARVDGDAVAVVPQRVAVLVQRQFTGHVGADEVGGERIVRGGADVHAGALIGGDDTARERIVRTTGQEHAV